MKAKKRKILTIEVDTCLTNRELQTARAVMLEVRPSPGHHTWTKAMPIVQVEVNAVQVSTPSRPRNRRRK